MNKTTGNIFVYSNRAQAAEHGELAALGITAILISAVLIGAVLLEVLG